MVVSQLVMSFLLFRIVLLEFKIRNKLLILIFRLASCTFSYSKKVFSIVLYCIDNGLCILNLFLPARSKVILS